MKSEIGARESAISGLFCKGEKTSEKHHCQVDPQISIDKCSVISKKHQAGPVGVQDGSSQSESFPEIFQGGPDTVCISPMATTPRHEVQGLRIPMCPASWRSWYTTAETKVRAGSDGDMMLFRRLLLLKPPPVCLLQCADHPTQVGPRWDQTAHPARDRRV